jgi:hypothetical protein
MVHLIQVDVIRLEALEAGLARALDMQCGQAALVRPRAHLPVHLRGEDDLVASRPLGKPPADDLLGDARAQVAAVDVRRVEEVQPVLQRAIHDAVAVRLRSVGTEVHGP